mmetsp:Transcript_38534/g.93223  ORF Transcript_38534/g.93223 Transcript_38534/m.93223 type:complete len:264 (+) Transcript_38534:540-1331(+)
MINNNRSNLDKQGSQFPSSLQGHSLVPSTNTGTTDKDIGYRSSSSRHVRQGRLNLKGVGILRQVHYIWFGQSSNGQGFECPATERTPWFGEYDHGVLLNDVSDAILFGKIAVVVVVVVLILFQFSFLFGLCLHLLLLLCLVHDGLIAVVVVVLLDCHFGCGTSDRSVLLTSQPSFRIQCRLGSFGCSCNGLFVLCINHFTSRKYTFHRCGRNHSCRVGRRQVVVVTVVVQANQTILFQGQAIGDPIRIRCSTNHKKGTITFNI